MGAGKIALLAAGVVAGLAAGAYMAAPARRGVGHLGPRPATLAVARRARRRGDRRRAVIVNRRGRRPICHHTNVADAYAADHAATFDSDDDSDIDADFDEDEDAAEDDDDAEFDAGDDVDDDDLAGDDSDADADGEDEFASADPELEDRVLEAFVERSRAAPSAPWTSARSTQGTIELTGAVQTREEYEHATTLARGVPGVRDRGQSPGRPARMRRSKTTPLPTTAGDPRYAESGWEGDIVGTGRRRQGTSDDVDRHEDPKVPLEDRATSEDAAERNAAGDIDDIAERRRRRGRSGSRSRAGGAEAEPRQEPPAT